jgi:uncharacterized integral membrane protein
MKFQRLYIFFLLLGIVLVIFSVGNADPVTVKFISLEYEISLSLLIILSMALGAILSIIFSINEFVRLNSKLKAKEREIKKLKESGTIHKGEGARVL